MIHSTAIIRSDVPDDINIGPFSVIGENVQFGKNTCICSHAVVEGPSTFGDGVVIGNNAVIGTDPQDLKYGGETTELIVGAGTEFREFTNVNRGTNVTGRTLIGSNCFLMAFTHVAHDCEIGNGVILANAVNLGGHVEIGDYATVGGVVPVHQFTRIGCYSMIGGGFRVVQDIPPYTLVGGYPLKVVSLNKVRLDRMGFSKNVIEELEDAFKLLFRDKTNRPKKKVAKELLTRPETCDEVKNLGNFILSCRRGLVC